MVRFSPAVSFPTTGGRDRQFWAMRNRHVEDRQIVEKKEYVLVGMVLYLFLRLQRNIPLEKQSRVQWDTFRIALPCGPRLDAVDLGSESYES